MLLSWQHCASPFLKLRVGKTGQTENTRCVNRSINEISGVKIICVNALTLTALVDRDVFLVDS